MMNWLNWLGLGQRDAADDPRIQQAVERAVDRVEPLLRQTGGYPGRYRKVLGQALRYADQVAAQIPGPVQLDREHYVREPFVRALLGSPDEIQRSLCLSRSMQEYRQHVEVCGGEIYALMGMRRRQKNIFGMESEGDVVRRDVAQQTVSFSDHTLSCIAPSEAEARTLVAWSIFDSLIDRVAQHLERLRQEKTALDKHRNELMSRLRGSSGEPRAALEKELGGLLTELSEATQRLNLDRIPGYFEELLRTPEALVRLERHSVRLDGMGIVRTRDDATDSHQLDFTDLLGRDRRRWSVTLVRCPQPRTPPLAERLEEANRWLAI